jgi:hypothetical protein
MRYLVTARVRPRPNAVNLLFVPLLVLVLAQPLAAAPVPGWARLELPATGSYLWRYLPRGVDLSRPAPVVLFLHGSGGTPDKYRPFVSKAADRAGMIVILPKSSTDLGWGTAEDERIVAESLRTVRAELPIDPGYGHNVLPAGAVENGFLFLVDKTHPVGLDGTPGCVPGPTALCLGGNRFRVEVSWKDFQGNTGPGAVVPGAAADSGLFWFFGPSNWELLVKVLDGCAVNGHHWVFAAATTTVEYVLTVTDTSTGEVATWRNPLGKASPAITATEALGGCP